MPDWTPHVRPRLSNLRLSPTREAEIVEELSQHLEDRYRELIAGGMPPDEAVRVALADFRDGHDLAESLAPLRQAHPSAAITPGAPGGRLLSDLRQDLRYAARTLWKRPGFTVVVVLMLAIGIGSNAAIFSVINAVLLRPLPFPHSEQLVSLHTRYLPPTGYDYRYFALSGPEFADLRGRVNAFAAIAAYQSGSRNLRRENGAAERVLSMSVTSGFFDVLGVRPIHGRAFTEEEAQRGAACLAVLSHGAIDESAGAIGSTIRLDDAPCEVIGVMPEGFGFRDDRVKVWTALRVSTEEGSRNSHGLRAIARLRDGVSLEQTDAQLQSLRGYWSKEYPDQYAKGHFAVIQPLHKYLVGDQRDALVLLAGAVLFVLLIVCVNLAALLISNGETRRREFAMRYALGADRRRLIRQMITEAMLLAVIGGVIGVTLANALLTGLLALYPRRLPVSPAITIDSAAMLYTCALVILAGLLVGLVPALQATGVRMQEILSTDSRTAASSRRAVAVRSALVIGQLALSMILLVSALLLLRSYQQLQRADLGLEADHVLTFNVAIPAGRERDPAAARRRLAAIEEQLAAIPGVEAAGAISSLPLVWAGPTDTFVIEGRPAPPPGEPAREARVVMTTPRMFRALGIPLKRGRLLADSDVAGQPSVAVINETAARLYWSGDDPIGKTINRSIQIVGIVGDVRAIGPGDPAPPAVYFPIAQAPGPPYEGGGSWAMTFIVRAPGNPTAITASARAAVVSVDAGLPLADIRTMSEIVSAASGQPRFTTLVISFLAVIAFFLAALGLYGTLAYSVEQRVREIGVRVALGADQREIMRLIIGHGLRLALAGVAVGVPSALALTRLMGGMLFGVSSTDPVTYLAVVVMLVISALLASYLPARRATRVDPIIALRAE
ncbi:MAG TPA: ABC transporter permease [Blastocatellia bacterium]|nr:ABC transporter permease [Blastocatellia bacterium]